MVASGKKVLSLSTHHICVSTINNFWFVCLFGWLEKDDLVFVTETKGLMEREQSDGPFQTPSRAGY